MLIEFRLILNYLQLPLCFINHGKLKPRKALKEMENIETQVCNGNNLGFIGYTLGKVLRSNS